jgi:hypothetical protein
MFLRGSPEARGWETRVLCSMRKVGRGECTAVLFGISAGLGILLYGQAYGRAMFSVPEERRQRAGGGRLHRSFSAKNAPQDDKSMNINQ